MTCAYVKHHQKPYFEPISPPFMVPKFFGALAYFFKTPKVVGITRIEDKYDHM
jgi:hypothetical protein